MSGGQPISRPRLRPLRLAAVALAVGVAAELGVVGAASLFLAPGVRRSWHGSNFPTRPWTVSVMGDGVSTRVEQFNENARVGIHDFEGLLSDQLVDVPSWSFVHTSSLPSTALEPFTVDDIAYGWPWRALRYRVVHRTPTEGSVAGGLDMAFLDVVGINMNRNDRRFPTIPIPGGLLGDVAAFGGAAVLPFAIWRLWRARAFDDRRRRGLCARCRYDLAGGLGTCPECGAAGPSPLT
jgi:hypothetical protein